MGEPETNNAPTPQDSVASLLEQLIAVAKEQLAVAQQTLQVAQESSTLLNALLAVGQQLQHVAVKSLDVAEQTLASSKRIEVLLGGEATVPPPASIHITYQYTLNKGAHP
jgi:hypothetical protein